MKKIVKILLVLSVLPLSSCASNMQGSITFYFNGGLSNDPTITETTLNETFKGVSGEKLEITVPSLTRDGYYFLGWYETCSLDSNNLCTNYTNKIDFSTPVIPYGQATAFAVFKKIVNITFNFNQSSFSSMEDTTFILEGYESKNIASSSIPSSTEEKVKNHYLSDTWYYDRECTQPFNFNNAVFGNENIILYGKWISNPTLTFLSGNEQRKGSFSNGLDIFVTNEYDFETVFDPTNLPALTRTSPNGISSIFEGWYLVNNENGNLVYTDYQYTFGNNPIGEKDITLYAKWKDSINIKVNYPDGSSITSSIYENMTFDASREITHVDDIYKTITNKNFVNFTYSTIDNTIQNEVFYKQSTIVNQEIIINANYTDYPTINVYYIDSSNNYIKVGDETFIVPNDSYLLSLGSYEQQTLNDNAVIDYFVENNSSLLEDYYIKDFLTYTFDNDNNIIKDEYDKYVLRSVSADNKVGDNPNMDIFIELVTYYKFNYEEQTIKLKQGEILTYSDVNNLVDTNKQSSSYKLESTLMNSFILDANHSYNTSLFANDYIWNISIPTLLSFKVVYNSTVIYENNNLSEGYLMNEIYSEIKTTLKNLGVENYYFYDLNVNSEVSVPSTLDRSYNIEIRV